jgi:hypothetical protein
VLYMTWKRQQDFVGRYVKFARHAAWGDRLNIPGLDSAAEGATPPVTGDDSDAMAQPLNRRQRRMQEKDAKKDKSEKKTKGIKAAKASPAPTPPNGSTGPRKRVVAENGKILVVDSVGNVYLEQIDEDGETHEFLLDVRDPIFYLQCLNKTPTNTRQPNELAKPTIRDTALCKLPVWAVNSVVGRFTKKPVTDEDEDSLDEGEATPASSSSDDFEVLEKGKMVAPNGNKVVKRKKSTRGQ